MERTFWLISTPGGAGYWAKLNGWLTSVEYATLFTHKATAEAELRQLKQLGYDGKVEEVTFKIHRV